jgi:phosphoribosyl 1,2-cyclic phosphodiesterase
MKLKVLGSSSKGNGYLVYNKVSCLIIEAGVPLKDVKKALDFDTSIIKGCIVSHYHQDHSKYIEEYAKAGIPIYAHESVFGDRNNHNFILINTHSSFKIGLFRIKPFELKHDVYNLGFLIDHADTGKFIFITDTASIPYNFKGLNNILVECNFDTKIIDENKTPFHLRDRVVYNHLSLEACKHFLMNTDLKQVNNIVLLHPSDSNSHISDFTKVLGASTGKDVYIAEKGLEIEFNFLPF